MSKGEEREFRLRPRKPPPPRQKGDRLAWAMAFKTVVVIGTGRKCISEAVAKLGHNLGVDIRAKGYSYLDSLAAVTQLDPSKDRVISLFDDPDFDCNQAVEQAACPPLAESERLLPRCL